MTRIFHWGISFPLIVCSRSNMLVFLQPLSSGRSDWVNTKSFLFLSSRIELVFLCLWVMASLVLCALFPLRSIFFFFSEQKMHLTPKILDLRYGASLASTFTVTQEGFIMVKSVLLGFPALCLQTPPSEPQTPHSPGTGVKRGKQALLRCNSSQPPVDISIRSEPCSVSLHWL